MSLRTFQVCRKGKSITPELVTAREFGKWFEKIFSSRLCADYLYVNSKDKGAEYHPGTAIGAYFDRNNFTAPEYFSWYIPKDSEVFPQLVVSKFIKKWDTNTSAKNNHDMLRCFTVAQVKLFITKVLKENGISDTSANLISYGGGTNCKKIQVSHNDSLKYQYYKSNNIKPLFLNSSEVACAVAVKQLEEKLGYKISIIAE